MNITSTFDRSSYNRIAALRVHTNKYDSTELAIDSNENFIKSSEKHNRP